MATAKKAVNRPPSREGKRFLGGYFPIEVWKQVSSIGVEFDKTTQELAEEAFADLIEKYRAKKKSRPGG